jgi:hypothetical protein
MTPPKRKPDPEPPSALLSRKEARDELIAAGVPSETAEQMLASARQAGSSRLPKYYRMVTCPNKEYDLYRVLSIESGSGS